MHLLFLIHCYRDMGDARKHFKKIILFFLLNVNKIHLREKKLHRKGKDAGRKWPFVFD